MQILKYPHPLLEQEGEPVRVFDDELRSKVAEMLEAMYAAAGVGLAAPQVGWSVRLFVMNPAGAEDRTGERVFANPEILGKWGKTVAEEGCLSFPGLTLHVPRAAKVHMRAQDAHGQWFEVEAEELGARILQHEYDHLLGVLFIAKMSPADKIAADKKLRELRAAAVV